MKRNEVFYMFSAAIADVSITLFLRYHDFHLVHNKHTQHWINLRDEREEQKKNVFFFLCWRWSCLRYSSLVSFKKNESRNFFVLLIFLFLPLLIFTIFSACLFLCWQDVTWCDVMNAVKTLFISSILIHTQLWPESVDFVRARRKRFECFVLLFNFVEKEK